MIRDGYWYGLSLLAVAAGVWALTGAWWWAVPPVLLALFFLQFFRDPQRAISQEPHMLVSPADGKITSVDRVQMPEGERLRISIFLNVFNVHVNRAPVSGTVREVRYQKGAFVNAMDADSADKNEQNICVMDADDGYTVVFKQIAGLLARRIVFNHKAGDRLERGQRVGLIKFGSRTDLLLPAHAQVRVAVGEHVSGGSTVLATVAPVLVNTPPVELAGQAR